MHRYILIDRHSGYIFGDTADFAAGREFDTPAEAAAILHETLLDGAVAFEACGDRDEHAVYDVYQADINGSDAVGVVHDGQDQETIDAVVAACEHVSTLRRAQAA